MSNIAELKKKILEARDSEDLGLELNLLKQLNNTKRPKVRTVKQAYAQLSDSP